MPTYEVTITNTYTITADDSQEAKEVAAAAMGEEVYEIFDYNETAQPDDFHEITVKIVAEH